MLFSQLIVMVMVMLLLMVVSFGRVSRVDPDPSRSLSLLGDLFLNDSDTLLASDFMHAPKSKQYELSTVSANFACRHLCSAAVALPRNNQEVLSKRVTI